MPEFINTVATIVAAFFLLSLAVETILENFRGVLAILGINVLKSKMTIDQALAEAAEFVPVDSKEFASFVRLATFVRDSDDSIASLKDSAIELLGKAEAAVSPEAKGALIASYKAKLSAEAAPIRAKMERDEERRVFVLRIISTAIGIGVAWAVGLNVLQITGATNSPTANGYEFLGYILGGLAAAGGSSFWHDQLDRVRNVKQLGQQLVSLKS